MVGHGMERGSAAIVRDASRALTLLHRAVELRRSAAGSAPPPTWQRTLAELQAGLNAAAGDGGALSLLVGDAGLYVGSDVVLEDSGETSLPAILRRDAIASIELTRGMTVAEIHALIEDLVESVEFRGLGDDAFTRLWRRQLEHVRTVPAETREPTAAEEVGAIVAELFGEEAAGSRSALAADLSRDRPAYRPAPVRLRRELAAELESSGPPSALSLASEAMVEALGSSLAPADVDEILRGAIHLLDALLAAKDLGRAAALIAAARGARAPSERVDLFFEEALTEDRTRAVLAIHKDLQSEETFRGIVEFFRGLGMHAAPLIFHLLPSLVEPEQRRQLSNVVIEIGKIDLDRVKSLIGSDLNFVVQEGVYLLSKTDSDEARSLLGSLKTSPRIDVRAGLADIIDTLDGEAAYQLGEELLKDASMSVRIKAAHALARINDKIAARLIENAVHAPSFEDAPLEQKRAFFEAYAISNQVRALLSLSKYMKKADGLLVKKEVEDLGVAAVEAMVHIPTPRTVEFLKEGAVMKNKRVREMAREVLQRFKERAH
jgi:hypothetical protein